MHELTISGGVPVERHLCESCAAEAGLLTQSQAPLSELLTKFAVQASGQGAGAGGEKEPGKPAPAGVARRVQKCPTCGTSFAEFKQTGRLGCPGCYAAFEAQLEPILDQAHEGGTEHVGKQTPVRGTPGAEESRERAQARTRRLEHIRTTLREAIESEQYERAAALRDELRREEHEGEVSS